ncbi:MAG: hypothetical protein D3923_16325 [Candidatus Electrothrix sp. AR3]|nr:hypothetical protein [Candidatus Electrothrix sp. AR3]
MGIDFNEDLLAALSESGRGMYYFIDHPESMNSILAKEFKSVEQLAVADIKITITLSHDLVIDQVFANNSKIRGNTVSVRFGDLAAGDRRRMQLRLRPRHRGAGISSNAAQVDVSYLVPGNATPLALSQRLSLKYTEDKKEAEVHQDKEVAERSAVFEANYARAEAAKAFDQGDQDKADNILNRAKKKLKAAPVASSRVQEEISDIDAYQGIINQPMSKKQRNLEQKRVKYKSQAIEAY